MPNCIDFDVRGARGATATVRRLPVKPGASFLKGQFLVWTATGVDGPPAAGSNYAPTSNTTRIAGRAMGPSLDPTSGLALAFMDVEIAEPGTQFPICLYHSTPASAVASLGLLAAGKYELRNSTAINGVSIPMVDLTATTNPAVMIMDFVVTYQGLGENPNWPVSVAGSVQNCLVWVEFLGLACAFTGAR